MEREVETWTFPAVSGGVGRPSVQVAASNRPEQIGQTLPESFGYLFDVHQRNVPDSALDPNVVGAVQAASLRGLFLIDLLFLADADEWRGQNEYGCRAASRRILPINSQCVHTR